MADDRVPTLLLAATGGAVQPNRANACSWVGDTTGKGARVCVASKASRQVGMQPILAEYDSLAKAVKCLNIPVPHHEIS